MRCERKASGRGKRRTLWICSVVLFGVLVLEMTAGCGRKKPPRPFQQDTAQPFVLGEHDA